jgi:MFS family permease
LAESVAEVQSSAVENLPSYYRRNAWAFALDMGLFHVGINFIGSTTVLPSFVALLTQSEVIVGLASGITSGAWMLPQLFIASYVTRLPRKKPLVVRTAFLTRPIFLIMALVTWLYGVRAPTLTLGVALLCVAAYFAFDALVSVPWFDLMAKGLPPRRRGRVQGIAQAIGGIGGVGAGVLVRYVLSDASPWAFPANYAVLFVIGTGIFMLSALALSFIYEPKSPLSEETPPSVIQLLASLPRIIAQDRPFVWLLAVKIVSGFVGLASAFYVLNATRNLGFGLADTGLFISAQVVGQVGSGLLIGVVQDRWGPLVHIRLNVLISALPPILALLASLFAGGPAVLYLYLLVYFCLGVYMGSIGWPFFNWIMEHAPESRRPLYIGASNTLGGILMLAPILGGWIVRSVSYPAAFATAAAIALVSLALSARLPSTR